MRKQPYKQFNNTSPGALRIKSAETSVGAAGAAFANLAQKLVAVPKSEIDAARDQEKHQQS